MRKTKIVFVLCNFISIIALSLLFLADVHAQCNSGIVSGFAFDDINNDGIHGGTVETKLSGVIVRLYNADGRLVNQGITDGQGAYQFSGLTDGSQYMVVFDADMHISDSGIHNGSDVQRVTSPYCDANIGLLSSTDNCDRETEIFLSCFVNSGVSGDPGQETIIGLTNNFNTASSVNVYATQQETGSVWGLAYNNKTNEIYSSAFVKQNSDLGTGGHSAIYTTNPTTGTTSMLTRLSALGQTVGSLSVTNASDCEYGVQAGKIGNGAIAIDDNAEYLYVVNLYNRSVVSIDLNNISARTTQSFNIPNPECSYNDYRPFALKFHNGSLYVGVTCTAETSLNDVETSMHVYRMTPSSGNFSLEFSTDFAGGHWNDTPDWKQRSQWLTDIDFTSDGDMVLGVSDRIGHRFCHDISDSRLDDQFGDILYVANVNGSWELENNGQAGNKNGVGYTNGYGPGGGEFFGDDFFPANPEVHPEVAIGSILIVPGTDEVISSVFDPGFNTYSGGLHRYSTEDGSKISSKELYNRNLTTYFGKATGFGDIIAGCGSTGSSIGNFVWIDENENGVQDAGETPVSNLDITLYDRDCNVVATTSTNTKGQYYFNNLPSNATYYVAISSDVYDADNAAYLINGNLYSATVSSSNAQLNSNLGNASPCLDFPSIEATTSYGLNPTFDIGLVSSNEFDLALRKTLASSGQIKKGDLVEFNIEVFNQGNVTASNFEIVDYLTPAFAFSAANNTGWTNDNGTLSRTINATLAPGQSTDVNIFLSVVGSANVADYINYAEISAATDNNGRPAEDVDSTPDDIPNNDNGDKETNDMISNDGSMDEDDHDHEEICVFDLALRNTVRPKASYDVNDIVTFDITVFNQGNVAANSFDISALFPGSLNYNAAANPDWNLSGLNVISMRSEQNLAPGEQQTYSIEFDINSFSESGEIVVYAEISNFSSAKAIAAVDFDSTPDDDFGNDNGDATTDDNIDDDGTIDEDDSDPAYVSVRMFDLALIKSTDTEFAVAGDEVVFEIQLHNQGSTAVSSVMIMDYLPEGMTIADDSWTIEPSDPTQRTFYKNVNFPEGLGAGEVHLDYITVIIEEAVKPGFVINYAEIGQVIDMNGVNVSGLDVDSTPDKDMLNDLGGLMGSFTDDFLLGTGVDDEDDHDPEGIYTATIEIGDPCVCKNNATNQFDGQFDETVVVTAPSGMTWYIDYVINLFSTTSAAPPAMPTPYVTGSGGVTLTEVVLADGVSEYHLAGIVIDDTDYTLRVTNGQGAFLQVSGGGSNCVYADPVIKSDGLTAVCGGSEFTYCIDPIAGCTAYNWSLSSGGSIVGGSTGACVTIAWDSSIGGPHTITMTPSCVTGCVAPAVTSVNIGMNAGPMSCLHEVNVSLGNDCRTVLQPETFLTSPIISGVNYQLMVMDHHGDPIPNNLVTEDYLWERLMVKVVNPCDGNSCWSFVNIEDKLAPTIQCEDIEMFCWQAHTYEPLVYDNCSTAEYELINETTTVLECDPDFIKQVNRTYVAKDGYGNVSDPCEQEIKLRRVPIDSSMIVWPDSLLIRDMTNLTCHDSIYNKTGYPKTSITGVPTLDGLGLYPFGDFYCELYVDYDDFVVAEFGCIKKIMRTWTIYENWCSDGMLINYVQVIEIGDLTPPTVTCPADLTVNADGTPGCQRTVTIPLPTVVDDCTNNFQIDFSYSHGIDFDVQTAPSVTMASGTNSVKYNVYDACGNLTTCEVNVVVSDNVAPVAICDEHTSVSLRSDGKAKAFAYTFDDGSYDDCAMHKFLVRKMVNTCTDCPVPTFDDFTYLGERSGRYYYLSDYKTHGNKSFQYSTAHGGMIATFETAAECNWVDEKVRELGSGTTYYIGLSDKGHPTQFTWVNHLEPNFNKWLGGTPGNAGSSVITDENGNWVVVNGNTTEAQFVMEISDPCGFSDEVHFCCEDVAEDQMVVFRVVDYFGLYNDCMVNVDVQDKIAPEITCPPDLSIDCDYVFDINDLSEFGEATASDVCSVEMLTTVEEGVNSCGQGMIYRRFAAWDDNDTSFCTQIISLENRDVFDLSSVDFPEDYFTDQGCNSGDLLPENLPEQYGFPTWDIDACSLIGATYTDEEFTFAGPDSDACLKILRTWSVIDWCQMDDPGYTPIEYYQTIKVTNVIGPEIVSGCDTLRMATADCEFADVSFTVSATDDCTEPGRISNTIRLEFSDGNVFSDNGSSNTFAFAGKVPVGEHVAFLSFSDLCGNTTTCAKIIQVVNNKPPTAACVNGLSVALEPMDFDNDGIPDDEMACITVDMVDASSTHICGFDIDLSFSEDVFQDKKFFDCDDKGLNIVELWVTDEFGNTAFCETVIDVQDNNDVDFCPVFDLALRKVLTTAGPYEPGDDITYDIEIFNQGNVFAYDINVVDYIPACLILNDTNWTDNGNGQATLNTPIASLEDSTATTVQITFTIDPTCQPQEITNFAEISSADDDQDPTNDPPNDKDSTPDEDVNNDGPADNNEVNEDGTIGEDEDDHDPESLTVSVFDLALTKVINTNATPGPFSPGDDVVFDITVFNQGSVSATNVEVTDYIPAGLVFNSAANPSWVASGSNATTNIISVPARGSAFTSITLTIDDSFSGSQIINNAEITAATNPDNLEDQDDPLGNTNDGSSSELSSDDDIADDSTGGTDNPNDEDDYDPAEINISCDLAPICSSADDFQVTLGTDGTVSITVDDINNGSQPICDNSTITASIDVNQFTCDEVGNSGNVVTLTILDSNGQSSTCTTNVTVVDPVDPMVECQDIMTTFDENGFPVIVEANIITSSSDNCGIVDTSIDLTGLDPGTLDCDPFNATLTVTDASGNTDDCVFQISIENSPPFANCRDFTINLRADNTVSITPDRVDDNSTDDCTENLTLAIDRDQFDCSDLGTNTVVLTVTDASGLSSTCEATVTIEEENPPVAVCQDITVEINNAGSATIVAADVDGGSSDACGNVTLAIDEDTFTCADKGNNTVRLTVTDESGNTDRCNARVTVEDNIDPRVTCIDDFTISLGTAPMQLDVDHFISSATDNCNVVSQTAAPLVFDCDDAGSTITVNVVITDDCGNTDACDVEVTVEDVDAPSCSLIAGGMQFPANSMITLDQILLDYTDNCNTAAASANISQTLFDCDELGTQTINVTVTDDSGNVSDVCSTTIVIFDPSDPICVANDLTVELGANGTYTITAMDEMLISAGSSAGCDGTIDVDFAGPINCDDVGQPIDVDVTVTTSSGAQAQCDARIIVEDNTPPTVNCRNNLTVNLDASGEATITASDIVTSSNDNCPITTSIDIDQFDCSDIGTVQVVTATVTDNANNSTSCTTDVTVEDNFDPSCTLIAPGMTFPVNATITVDQLLATFTDNCNSAAASATISQDQFDCDELGTQTIEVTVTDDSGNVSDVCSTTIEVIDPSTPVCTPNDITVSLDAIGSYTLTTADTLALYAGSSSGCAGSIDIDYAGPILCNLVGTPLCVNITVTTSENVSATCKANIVVEDNMPPTINCRNTLTLDINASGVATVTPSMVISSSSDNCGFTTSIDISSLDCSDKASPTTVTATATDQAGNMSTCTTLVSVEDNLDPVCALTSGLIFAPGEVITVDAVLQTFADNCAIASSASSVTPDMFTCADVPNSPLPITVTVTDDCGNTGTCSTFVTIADNGPPTARCQDITVGLNANGEVIIQGVDVDGGSSTPCGASNFTYSVTPDSFDCDDIGDNVVTLTVTTITGLTSTCNAVVTVVDALPPTIVCPPNENLPCTADVSDLSMFGVPTVLDNCSSNTMTTEDVIDNTNSCNVGTLTRRFTVTDGFGNTASCDQVITINPPNNPISITDITFDSTFVRLNNCFDPNNLPEFPPVVDDSNAECSDIEITFTDTDPTAGFDPCNDAIIRSYTVTDHCQGMSWNFTQNYILQDNIGPEITNAPSDIRIELDSTFASCDTFLNLPATVTDCVTGFTATNDSPFAITNNSADASGTYTGSTTVTLTATDVCGNTATHAYDVQVIDVTATIKTCDKIIVTIEPNMMVDVPVDLTDAVFCSICDDNQFQISWSDTDPNVDVMTVDCSFLGITDYIVYFWHDNVLVNDCTSILQVLDGNGHCMTTNITSRVAGEVFTEDHDMVAEVEVELAGSPFETMTDQDGKYAFPTMETGGQYKVIPEKDKDYLNGVSTSDLIAIQKHILGNQLLSSPYKIIAADVDNSETITALDLIELRKLILGVYDELPDNTSWRMIDAHHDFVDPLQPFINALPEQYHIAQFNENMVVDFVGVKVGDVNNTVVANLYDEVIEKRNEEKFVFDIEEKLYQVGDLITLTLGSEMLDKIEGLQMSLSLDNNRVEMLHYDAHVSDLMDNNFNIDAFYNGEIRMSWHKTTESKDVGNDLFTISMRAKAPIWSSEVFQIDEKYMNAEAYSESGIHDIDFNYTKDSATSEEFVLYQNQPNPWSEMTNVRFYAPHLGDAKVMFYDVDGKVLLSKDIETVIGINELTIYKHELGANGVIYYEVITDHYKGNSKMLLLK